jgi:anti-sigma-K factor RskA
MTELENIDALAAEYVLGTLEADERLSVTERRQREGALDAAIADWERRLAPIMETVPALKPRSDLFAEIETRLTVRQAALLTGSQVVQLERRARRWRRIAIAAMAVAASLLVVIGVRETVRSQIPKNYVAVFQKDDASPAFLLSVDLQTRVLSIQPVAAQAQPGKSYQLWIASEKLGGAPQSLGLIEDHSNVTRRVLASYDPVIVEHATFGISLEPVGGSPTGRPTGPAFHAKLIPAPR